MDFLVALGVSIVKEFAKYTVAPIGRELGYLYYYKRDINNLNTQIQNLEQKETSINGKVNEARTRGEAPTKEVLEWLAEVAKELEVANQFLVNEDHGKAQCDSCVSGSFSNLLLRRKLSKEARKIAQTIASVIEKAGSLRNNISKIPSLRRSFKSRDFVDIDSRKQTLKEIMETLKDPAHHMIGVYGAGGIGKTTLVKKVAEMALEEGLYSKVVMVTISQMFKVSEKQKEIAEKLGLKMPEETESARADRLKQGLREQRKVLIVLDDIWETKIPNLSKIGIEFQDEQSDCKILLVSRDRHVLCNRMNVNKNIELQFLSDPEAMNLFQKFFGGMIESSFQSLATDIIRECKGLPVAIVPIACTLRNRDISSWRDALNKLRSSPLVGYPEAYPSIRTSYDSIQSDQEKMILLLCSLYREDTNIHVENLMGIHAAACNLFQDMDTLEAVRDSLQTLVERLKDRCLLLNGDSPGTVKMHDVIRDIMMSIASEDGRMYCFANFPKFEGCLKDGKLKDSTAISLLGRDFDQLPDELACPNLKLLLLPEKYQARIDYQSLWFRKKYEHEENVSWRSENQAHKENLSWHGKSELNIPGKCFEAAKELRALHLSSIALGPLPPSLCSLQNLVTLSFQNCELENIALLGELKNLLVLDLSYSEFDLLPEQIGNLTRLRQLNLNHCKSLKVIQPNVFSSLVQLEELYMDEVDVFWKSEAVWNGRNASLIELKNLKQLRDLHLYILFATCLPKDIFVGENLERYHIIVGGHTMNSEFVTSSRVLCLKLEESCLSYQEYGFQSLMKKSEVLCLSTLPGVNNIAPQLDIDGFPQLKSLEICGNNKVTHIVESCHGRFTAEPFGRLREINVRFCSQLRNVFSFSIAKQLVNISVHDCIMMKEIVYHGSEDDVSNALNVEATDDNIEFPTLQSLSLHFLPKLIQFFGSESSSPDSPRPLFNKKVVFPTLKHLDLYRMYFSAMCPDRLPTSSFIESLSSLSVVCCNELKHLLTFRIGGSLKQLERLEIMDCLIMEELIVIHEQVEEEEKRSKKNVLFPRLRYLALERLFSLKKICALDCMVECESLLTLAIEDCPKLETSIFKCTLARANEETEQPLFIGKIASPRLEYLTIISCHSLKYLLSCSAASSLLHLKSIQVDNCEAMEQIVMLTKELLSDQVISILFPKLETIELSELQNLERLSSSNGTSLECPSLMKLKIYYCPKLATMAMKDEKYQVEKRASVYIQPLINEEVAVSNILSQPLHISFSNLQELLIFKCDSLVHLFPFLAVGSLAQLKKLKICDCAVMEVVVTVPKAHGEDQEGLSRLNDHKILLPKLECLWLSNLPKLKMVCEGDPFECPSLLNINVEHCHSLTTFVCDSAHIAPYTLTSAAIEQEVGTRNLRGNPHEPLVNQKIASPRLEHLSIKSCHSLKYLLSCSTASSFLHLMYLNVQYCKAMEHIVMMTKESLSDQVISILLPKLKTIELSELRNLKRLSSSNGISVECPSLMNLEIDDCPKLATMAMKDEKYQVETKASVYTPLADEKVAVPNILNQPLQMSFRNLQGLVIFKCNSLVRLFPFSAVESLTQLKSLSIRDCAVMQVVVTAPKAHGENQEGLSRLNDHKNLFPRLEYLGLSNLPKLEMFYEGDPIECPSLLVIKVKYCDSLRTFVSDSAYIAPYTLTSAAIEQEVPLVIQKIASPRLERLTIKSCDSLRYLLSCSAASSLLHLQYLNVQYCEAMKHIVMMTKELPSDQVISILFPKLETIEFSRLRKLKRFSSSNGISTECPSLTKLEIDDCPKLISMVMKDEKYQVEKRTSVYTQPLTNEKVAVPNVLNQRSQMNFRNLQELLIFKCDSLVHLFPFSAVESLTQLKNLSIRGCAAMEVVVTVPKAHGEDQEGLSRLNDHKNLLPKLERLWLSDLPRLKMFCEGDPIECPSLLEIKVEYCYSMTSASDSAHIAPYTMTSAAVQQEVGRRDLLVNPHDLLVIQKIVSPRLEYLTIEYCHSLKYLLTCSGASSLLHLKSMQVNNCGSMEQIVMMTKEFLSDQVISISFPKLEIVQLYKLKNLKRISSLDGTSIECPSLMNLKIRDCLKLATMAMKDEKYQAEKRDSVHTQPLTSNKVAVPNILNQRLQMSFRNLQELLIFKCDSLVHLFPFSAVESLTQLKYLSIRDCAVIKVVFTVPKAHAEDQEGLSRLNDHKIILPKLECLWLSDLPKLEMFCEGDRIECSSLKKLQIKDCDSLRTYVSDSAHTAPQTLTGTIEQEVGRKDLRVNRQPLFNQKIAFPKLERLSLQGKSVNNIWSQFSAALASPTLKVIKSWSPRDQTSFIPFDIHVHQNLEKINLEGIWVEKIWQHREFGSAEQHHHMSLTHLKLNRLPKLVQLFEEPYVGQLPQSFEISETPEVESHGRLKTLLVISYSVSFPNLTHLEVSECHGIINLLSSSTAKSLVQLKRMIIDDCKRLREVIIGDKLEGEAESSSGIVFGRLETISLHRLPSVRSFYGGDSNLQFPLLENVIVSECPELKIFSNSGTSTPKLDKVITKTEFRYGFTTRRYAISIEETWEGDLNGSVRKNWENNVCSYATALQRLFAETSDWYSDEEHIAAYQKVQSSRESTASSSELAMKHDLYSDEEHIATYKEVQSFGESNDSSSELTIKRNWDSDEEHIATYQDVHSSGESTDPSSELARNWDSDEEHIAAYQDVHSSGESIDSSSELAARWNWDSDEEHVAAHQEVYSSEESTNSSLGSPKKGNWDSSEKHIATYREVQISGESTESFSDSFSE